MAEVVLKNVRKNYDPAVMQDTLRDINLDIKDGDFIVFVGPSGCGKSTLLRMIAGLEDITDGELTISSQRMNEVAECRHGVPVLRIVSAHGQPREYVLWFETEKDREWRDNKSCGQGC